MVLYKPFVQFFFLLTYICKMVIFQMRVDCKVRLAPKTGDSKVIVTQQFNYNHQALCFFYTFWSLGQYDQEMLYGLCWDWVLWYVVKLVSYYYNIDFCNYKFGWCMKRFYYLCNFLLITRFSKMTKFEV